MSKESDLFVDNLRASLPFMAVESEKLYKGKLANRKLPRELWSKALDNIIAANLEGKLPTLAVIFQELDRQQRISRIEKNTGKAFFRLNGRDMVIFIECVNRTWLISDKISTDSNGVQHHLQAHIGEPAVDHIPAHATDFNIEVDFPVYNPEDMPSKVEVKEFMAIIASNLAKIGAT